MKLTTLKTIIATISLTFVDMQALAEEKVDRFHLDVSRSKEWLIKVLPFFGICTLDNTVWMHATMETPSGDLQKIAKLTLNKTVYQHRTAIEFNFIPAQQIYSVYAISQKLSLAEGQYSVEMVFDNVSRVYMTGYVSKKLVPEEGIYGETHKNVIFFRHKDFLREVVPKMKKHNNMIFSINGQRIPHVSLMGFTNAFDEMKKCMGEAVTYDLYDPF